MPRAPKKQRLNIFLMKDQTTTDQVLDSLDELQSFPISVDFSFSGTIYVKSSNSSPPGWRNFVQAGTPASLGNLFNQHAACLVVINVESRVFAIAFGSGRHWIDDNKIERRFGMIATLNAVDPKSIRSVDREEFDTITRKTRSQTSSSTTMENFGLDIQRDLLRSVTGKPQNSNFADHVTGADNLILNTSVTFAQLGDKCTQALDYYQLTTYRERYAWIDNFMRIKDPTIIERLDNGLIGALRDNNTENIFLSPPTMLDTQEHRGFRYHSERASNELHPDLKLSDFLVSIHRETVDINTPNNLNIQNLKHWKIKEYTTSGDHEARKFSVYDAIVYEIREGEKLHTLSAGEWYEIDQNYVAEVSRNLEIVQDCTGDYLCNAEPGETEPAYNIRAAEVSNNYLGLLDRKLVQYGGGKSSIEICDLLSADKNFIHIKSKTKSSALSHLFAQGINSAQVLRDLRFQELALTKCPETHHHIFNGQLKATDCTITYAIITGAQGSLREALPFFTKQSLANATRELSNMGYNVRLKKIPIGSDAA